MMPCPGTHRLRELLDETLGAEERAEVEKHVETCPVCEEVLEMLTSADSSFLGEPVLGMELNGFAAPGQRFRNLRLFNTRGGQGNLFIARDEELERDVAVKKIKDKFAHDWRRRGELIREALITASLEHPGIVPVYGLGYGSDGHSYYAMRLIRTLVEGDQRDERDNTLETAIAGLHAGRPGWTLHKLLDRFIAVCNTIQYAHDQGVLHCDLKPSNIILGPYGETLVLDWGAARAIVEPRRLPPPPDRHAGNGEATDEVEPAWFSPAATFQLTPPYASPEQLAGRIDEMGRASDVYSLGAILCCLLTGHAPLREGQNGPEPGQDGRPRLPRPLRRATKGPGALEAICARALEHRPGDRYSSARSLADDVGHWLADEPVVAHREGWAGRFLRLARQHRAWTHAGAVALVVVTSVSVAGAILVNGARREAVAMSAEMAHDRGMALCEQGEIDRGVHWLARSLEISPGAEDNLRRVNLAAWSARLCSLTAYRKFEHRAEPVTCDRAGRLMLTVDPSGHVDIWDAKTGKHNRLEGVVQGRARGVFSPEGKTLLVFDETTAARLWDTSTGRPAAPPLTHTGMIWEAVFSQDGQTVLAGCDDGTIFAWDAKSGGLVVPPFRHGSEVYSVALGRDGRVALTGGADGAARSWKLIPGKPATSGPPMVHSPGKGIVSVALSPDGRTVLTGSVDHQARLWSARTGAPISRPLDHDGRVEIVAFSPDGRLALTASANGDARLWEAASGKPLGRPMRHQRRILDAGFSPDGRAVLTGSADTTARLWDAFSGEPLGPALLHQAGVRVVAWSADGEFVLTGSLDGTSRIWELPAGRGSGLLSSGKRGPIDVSGDPPSLASPHGASTGPGSGGQPGQPAAVAGGRRRRRVVLSTEVVSLAFDATGSMILTVTTGGTARLWQAHTGEPIGPGIRHGAPLHEAALSPDGRRVLTASDDGTARLWDSATGICLRILPHRAAVLTAAFNPADSGRTAITGSADGTAWAWDTITGTPLGPPMKHADYVLDAVFCRDGRTALSGCQDGTIRHWNTRTGELLGHLRPIATKISKLVFSGDGRALLLGTEDGTSRIVDPTTGGLLGPPLFHRGQLRAAAFAYGGGVVLTASDEDTIRAWNIGSGRAIGEPLSHPEIFSLAVSPDGLTAVTGSAEGEIRLWPLLRSLDGNPEQLARRLQSLTGVELERSGAIRLLTPEQWEDRRKRLDERKGPPGL